MDQLFFSKILIEVPTVLIGRSEFYRHQYSVFMWIVNFSRRNDRSNNSLLQKINDFPSIYHVSRKAIQLPTYE
ncbi:MAG: hypothetical protein JWN76_530 [Chitinophagaceae bacterium]|nr:hypothetical protein [Chitinophagaceae bacterium]